MDHGRRNRRGRYQSQNTTGYQYSTRTPKPWSFLSGFYSLVIMCSLLSVIYLMLEYHCQTCTTKCDVRGITRNIDDIAKNLSLIKNNYQDLEVKISRFAQELPKLEGQIEILEALSNSVEAKDFGWKENTPLYFQKANPIRRYIGINTGNFNKTN